VDFKIRITQKAIADFEAILDYSWTNFPGTAERFASGLLNHLDLLRRFPRLGSVRPRRPGVRMMVHFPIHEDERLIEILHFWHGSRQEP
jgi:plasmid stabilization system protein ParE